jgi:hypothetical protein
MPLLSNSSICWRICPLAGQENDEGTVAPEELGTLDLPLEHAQLLTEEGVFEDQF